MSHTAMIEPLNNATSLVVMVIHYISSTNSCISARLNNAMILVVMVIHLNMHIYFHKVTQTTSDFNSLLHKNTKQMLRRMLVSLFLKWFSYWIIGRHKQTNTRLHHCVKVSLGNEEVFLASAESSMKFTDVFLNHEWTVTGCNCFTDVCISVCTLNTCPTNRHTHTHTLDLNWFSLIMIPIYSLIAKRHQINAI